MLDPAREALVEAAGFSLAGSDGDLDSCSTQCFEAMAGHGRIGIDGGGDDAGEARADQGIGAGRRAAGDAAGLEGDVGGAAADAVAGIFAAPRRSATISAWSSRSYSCQPSPITWPSRSRMTQPTAGLGEVTPMPRRASSSARCIQWRSSSDGVVMSDSRIE